MLSDPQEAFVWIWLPGESEPVVAGRLGPVGDVLGFAYGRSYLSRPDAIPIYEPELPLERGTHTPEMGVMPGAIKDAGPDAWGQRVILNSRFGAGGSEAEELRELAYLLASGSDRIGALDFQGSSDSYVPRAPDKATLDELAQSAERVEAGIPLAPALDQALLHGSSVGGARPKALLGDGERQLIAKFSSTSDPHSVVKGEYVAMELGRRAGLDVAPVSLSEALGKDVLLVERFDRPGRGERTPMVSALTMLRLDEYRGRHATYHELAHIVRERFRDPRETLRELFARITFNILTGNTDDHARNHAAFWDGKELALTPAYDICPQPRAGGEATQVMAIGEDGYQMSQVAGCVDRAHTYLLAESDAREIVAHQISTIENDWIEVCELAGLTGVDRAYFWHRQFLNPYALQGYRGP